MISHICPKTEIAKHAKGQKLQGPLAESVPAVTYTALKTLVNEECESRKGHRNAVMEQDSATRWLQAYECKTKTSHETEKSLQKCLEPKASPKVIYTEIIAICVRYISLTTTISHDNNNHRTSKHASTSWRSDGSPSCLGGSSHFGSRSKPTVHPCPLRWRGCGLLTNSPAHNNESKKTQHENNMVAEQVLRDLSVRRASVARSLGAQNKCCAISRCAEQVCVHEVCGRS